MLCASCGESIPTAPTASAPCPKCRGQAVLDERYRLLTIVGKGASGITYRAERVDDGAVFAVKEMPLRMLESAKAIELFEREARVLRELRHDAIPRYESDFVFGEGKNSALYLIQEFISGKTLDDEMKERRYDARAIWTVVAEVAGVLSYLHELSPPVLHRDVKPKNVMRRDDGRLVLIDFGAVRDALAPAGGSTVAGTFGYMAPEQLTGRATPASDLYALGALAAALFARKEPDEMLGDDHRIDVRAFAKVDDASLGLLGRMLEPDADKRIQTADEVKQRAASLAATAAPRPAEAKTRSKRDVRATEDANAHRGSEKRERRRRAQQERSRSRADATSPAVGRRESAREARERAIDVASREASSARSPEDASPVFFGARPLKRNAIVLSVAAAVLLVGAGAAGVVYLNGGRVRKAESLSRVTPGVPELYARPLAVDVNGDGVEDTLLTTLSDKGAESYEDGEDTWGKENGRFEAFVQAFDGSTGKVLYSLGSFGPGYTNGSKDAKAAQKHVLVTRGKFLGVAHVATKGPTTLELFDLATGVKQKKEVTFAASYGGVCETTEGRFYFDGADGAQGVLVDLEAGDAVATAKPAGCSHLSTHVADAPGKEIIDRTVFNPRFSRTIVLPGGPYKGTPAVTDDVVAAFIRDTNEKPTVPTGPTVSFDDGLGLPGGRDNTRIAVVGADPKTGESKFETSLASLGLNTEVADHVEVTAWGVLVFLQGNAGVASVNPSTGKLFWALRLPKGARRSSYTLSSTRLYIHVFGGDNTVYSAVSKKLASRVVEIDITKGTYVRSIPDGSLEVEATASRRPSLDPSVFRPVSGCTCVEAPLVPKRGAGTNTDAAGASNGARVSLGFYSGATTDYGSRKMFAAIYSLDVDDVRFVLPHYNERRERIAPPRTVEGDVPLGFACGEGLAVFAHGTIATAWSLTTKDELWTVDLADSRGAPKTMLGGGASISCAIGRVERGLVHVPGIPGQGSGEVVLSAQDGRPVVSRGDAGTARKPTR